MKTASHIARILLGLIFTVFGLNGFLHFIPLRLPSGVAGQFIGALFVSHYYVAVFAVQVAGGILLLSNRFVPLALTLVVEKDGHPRVRRRTGGSKRPAARIMR